ncbi:MAG TPA: hypothetical protein VGE97_08715 [Nitrososphaera sp.]|jgi:hypothetical protein
MAEAAPLSESILGSGAGGPLSAPTPWLLGVGYIYYPYGVVIGAPVGLGKGNGTLNTKALWIDGALVDLSKYVLWTGGTLTGMLTLYQDPTVAMHAATKQYVDNRITNTQAIFAGYLQLAGGTMTGDLILAGPPTVDLQPTTKKYVDDKLTGLIAVPDAPIDGTIYGRGGPSGGSNSWSGVFDAGTY